MATLVVQAADARELSNRTGTGLVPEIGRIPAPLTALTGTNNRPRSHPA